jgi:hypothetical protein
MTMLNVHPHNCECPICQWPPPSQRPHPQPSPNPNVAILHELREIKALILAMEKRVMARITDVNAALDDLATSLGNQLTSIQTEIQQLVDAGGGSADQLQAIVDRIGTLKAGVDSTITALNADDNPGGVGSAGSAASVP